MSGDTIPERALDLLLLFADRSCWEIVAPVEPLLRGVWHVGWQVQYLRLKSEITADDIATLSTTLRSPTGNFAAWSAAPILALSPPDEEWRVARAFLETLTPLERAEVLADWFWPRPQPLPAPGLADWLYERWLRHDRGAVGDAVFGQQPLNFLIALQTRRRPESRALLIEMWPHLSERDRETLFRWLHGFPDHGSEEASSQSPISGMETGTWAEEDQELLDACVDSDPVLRANLLARLALPLPYLLRHVGIDALLEQIERNTAAYCRSRHTDGCDPAGYDAFRAGFQYLRELPGQQVDALLRLLCLRSEFQPVHQEIRRIMWQRQWRRDRDEALMVARATAEEGNRAWATEVVRRLHEVMIEEGDRPRPEDREFLLWASWQRVPIFRWVAVAGLELLDEDSPGWRIRLAALARDRSTVVRVSAWGALARRGDKAAAERLIRMATRARSVYLRAEALRVLGEWDAERHLSILQNALLTDHAEVEYDTPAVREAATALRRLGTPEAYTVLVQAALAGTAKLWWLVMDCLSKGDPFAEPHQLPPPRHMWSFRPAAHRAWLMRLKDPFSFSTWLRWCMSRWWHRIS